MATSHHHEQYVTTFLDFSSLKIGKLTFTWGPLPSCTDLLLLLDAPIIVECRKFWLILWSELPSPEEGEPPGKHLGTPGIPYHFAVCHLQCTECKCNLTHSCEHECHQFCPHPSQTLPHLGLASNHQCYRQQLRTWLLPLTLRGFQALWPLFSSP